MAAMVKHPRELGFKLGLRIRIGKPARITGEPAAKTKDVVYVALLAGRSGTVNKRDVLKVGQTGRTLMQRWQGIMRIFDPKRKLRSNEREDRRKWLEAASGRDVWVWVKRAENVKIPYAKGLVERRFSTRCAEEEFLDEYYRPRIGMPLHR